MGEDFEMTIFWFYELFSVALGCFRNGQSRSVAWIGNLHTACMEGRATVASISVDTMRVLTGHLTGFCASPG